MKEFGRKVSRQSAVVSVVIAAIGLQSGLASADYAESVKSACKADFKKYCPSYDINSKALRRCMESVADELSTRCVNALERAGEGKRR